MRYHDPETAYQKYLWSKSLRIFIGYYIIIRVKSGDIVTLIGGLVVVIVVAILANSGTISGVQTFFHPPPTNVPVAAIPLPTPFLTLVPTQVLTPVPVPTPAPPYRIFYTSNPFSYPVYKLPENMGTFGASGNLGYGQEMVPFAFVEDTRGGVTQKFFVPYPVWGMNITVTANRTPQYGNFRVVLADATDGRIIDGGEILNRGSMYRIIHTSNTDVYMIISTAYIDRFRIDLETDRSYYDTFSPG
jgi:hypothetical protein